jgi:hypothetical protein
MEKAMMIFIHFTKSGNQLISGKVVDGKSKVELKMFNKVYYDLGVCQQTTTDSQGFYSIHVLCNKKDWEIIASKINKL